MQSINFQYFDIPPALCIIAGIVYTIKFKKLEKIERLIVLILFLNIFTDMTSNYIDYLKEETHVFYNVLIPVERTLTLLIYAFNEDEKIKKRIHYFGILLIWISAAAGLAYYQTLSEFHSFSNIFSGFILAVLSYLHLRSVSLNTAGQSPTLFYFGMANLIYFTLMISAMSALPLALQISDDFAGDIYDINIVGYALWSIILIIGILWKKQKI